MMMGTRCKRTWSWRCERNFHVRTPTRTSTARGHGRFRMPTTDGINALSEAALENSLSPDANLLMMRMILMAQSPILGTNLLCTVGITNRILVCS